jgi:hypothetical protein
MSLNHVFSDHYIVQSRQQPGRRSSSWPRRRRAWAGRAPTHRPRQRRPRKQAEHESGDAKEEGAREDPLPRPLPRRQRLHADRHRRTSDSAPPATPRRRARVRTPCTSDSAPPCGPRASQHKPPGEIGGATSDSGLHHRQPNPAAAGTTRVREGRGEENSECLREESEGIRWTAQN